MYCPKCAAPNEDGAKFCRACGEGLTAVAQAMSKHMPVLLASKLDEFISRKNERIRRDAILASMTGLFLLLSGIWQLASNSAAWHSAAFMFLGAVIMFAAGGWDMLAYKRSLSRKSADAELPAAARPDRLDTNDLSQRLPAASVTEQTTRKLGPGGSGPIGNR